MELYCEAAAQALPGARPLPRASSKPWTKDKAGDFLASPCSNPHLPTEKLFYFGAAGVSNTEENSDSLLFGFN